MGRANKNITYLLLRYLECEIAFFSWQIMCFFQLLVPNNGINKIVWVGKYQGRFTWFSSCWSFSIQCTRPAETHRVTWGLGGVVPSSYASGAVGTGWYCRHWSVCPGNSLSGHLCSAVWMLLQLRRREDKEKEEEFKGQSHLSVFR